jgi:hypothetical protein
MTALQWEMVTPFMHHVLRAIGQSTLCPRFYLAGGTALALQLGHRRSVDLDFFSESDEVRPEMHREALAALKSFQPTIVEQEWGNLLLLLGELRVGFFGYGYKLLQPTVDADGVPLASLLDLGLMKLDAVATRATRKDFCDLYFLAQVFPLRELLDAAPHKYPAHRDFEARAVRYLAYFDRADQEEPVPLAREISWEEIKAFFLEQATRLARQWWR